MMFHTETCILRLDLYGDTYFYAYLLLAPMSRELSNSHNSGCIAPGNPRDGREVGHPVRTEVS